MTRPVHIAIFASGSGSNAEAIIRHFKDSDIARVVLVVSNRQQARVLERAAQYNIATHVINREGFYKEHDLLQTLAAHKTDLIALAGFLWLVPTYLVDAFPRKIVNIHPALLPKFGGKGMYGLHVHKAVFESGENKSGMTIHYVDNQYDSGDIIFQKSVDLDEDDQPEDIAGKVLKLEHHYYPRVLEGIAAELKEQ